LNLSLVEQIKSCANSDGLPIIPPDIWENMNANHTKQEIKDALAYYIVNYKPKFPFREIEENTVVNKFAKFCKDDMSDFFFTTEQKSDVMEKYDDYKYPYKDCGNGIIQFGHYYNDVSNFFQQHNRMSCGSYGFASPLEIWKDENLLKKMNYTFWRLGNKEVGLHNWRGSFRLGSYVATQFKPHVAKSIYEMTNAKVVMDTSCGWGDRLAGFYASNAEEFYGCDPNENVFEVYKKQCLWYEKQLGCDDPYVHETNNYFYCSGKKMVTLFRSPAEDVNWLAICPPRGVDCMFTSPPYFSTELYNKGGENEADQSWSRYNEYDKWRDGFFFPMLNNVWPVIRENGFVFINIMDPVIKGTRYRTCDELVDFMKEKHKANFMGQLGMRIKQRPKKMKTGLQDFLRGVFIENAWCFTKGDGRIEIPSEVATLDSILGDDDELSE